MSRTATPAPTDKTMWRRLLGRAHPDHGGDGELFVWVRDLQDRVQNRGLGDGPTSRSSPPPPPTTPRVPFPATADFAQLTRRALLTADEVAPEFAKLLYLLRDCRPSPEYETAMFRGCSYKQIAYLGHLAGFGKTQRTKLYRIAEDVPLSEHHLGHLIAKIAND